MPIELNPLTEKEKPQIALNLYTYGKKVGTTRKRASRYIKSNEKLNELYDWMFSIFKRMGFYQRNRAIQADDKAIGELLGVSFEIVKRWRIRSGYIPSRKIYKRVKELERTLAIKVETKKDTTII